ncbi:MAG: glycosyl transferase family protein [Acidobacteria bacterium]|nr:glycosyl transferase family protein [Acidobacteriota bacterium]
MEVTPSPIATLDLLVHSLLVPLALWILVSGIDDLFIDAICFFTYISDRAWHPGRWRQQELHDALAAPQKRIAIFVPLWQEESVIRQMVSNNVNQIEYLSYDLFLGVYPNDTPTLTAARELEATFANVHTAVCGNPGPTSKADCLNWIYQRMLAFEREHQVRFEIIATHDAEDVVHPIALHWMNYHCDVYDMVQVPVLPLPTPIQSWTHGIYCDEFAEFQTKDMPGRQILGGFIPSNGVGTAFTRYAMERLAERTGRIFEPECLTEDYENGLKLHFLGCPQLFMPVQMQGGQPVATREYFPQTIKGAIKQRTRWVTGIALQSWERHGWRGSIGTVYWMWRDRKGLVGNPVSMLTSLMFVYGLLTWTWCRVTGVQWGLQGIASGMPTFVLLSFTSSMQFVHLGVRAWCTARIYGWSYASAVPIRAMLANYINFRATAGAVWRFAKSKVDGKPLVWLKTDHSYPALAAVGQRRRLGEILVTAGRISTAQLEWALRTKPQQVRLGEHLVRSRLLTEQQVYQALSLQASIPLLHIDPRRIRASTARALPVHVVEQWRVVPYQVAGGFLFLACAESPSESMKAELGKFTKLDIRWQLVTASNFAELRQALL